MAASLMFDFYLLNTKDAGVNDWMSAAELPGSNVITFFIGNTYSVKVTGLTLTDRQNKQ